PPDRGWGVSGESEAPCPWLQSCIDVVSEFPSFRVYSSLSWKPLKERERESLGSGEGSGSEFPSYSGRVRARNHPDTDGREIYMHRQSRGVRAAHATLPNLSRKLGNSETSGKQGTLRFPSFRPKLGNRPLRTRPHPRLASHR